MKRIKDSELIINSDGNIYHINIKPGILAENIILVGDPARVSKISRRFSKIEHQSQNREIITNTGIYNGIPISVVSTGMGTDNIDIIINELDALANIDFKTREPKKSFTKLNLIRIGTSGAIQPDITIHSIVASTHGVGLDGLLYFYNSDHVIEKELTKEFIAQTGSFSNLPKPYIVSCSEKLMKKVGHDLFQGITATAPGFYGPQGRTIRIPLRHVELSEKIKNFSFERHRVLNFEMETSALYGLGKLLGHDALTICAVIANRATGDFAVDYNKTIDEMIGLVLDRITS
ncbi:MAG TPA: nucleoside phosphorylase [Bacteroidales bacterium]|nr:nucleoside phosphorylase [Bacteroidales bacterium]